MGPGFHGLGYALYLPKDVLCVRSTSRGFLDYYLPGCGDRSALVRAAVRTHGILKKGNRMNSTKQFWALVRFQTSMNPFLWIFPLAFALPLLIEFQRLPEYHPSLGL